MTTHATEAKLDPYENPDWGGVLDAVPGPEGVLPCLDPAACGACEMFLARRGGESLADWGRRLLRSDPARRRTR